MMGLSVGLIITIVFLAFLLFLALEMHVSVALGAAGVLGLVLMQPWKQVTATLGSAPFHATALYSYAAIPMFILIGMFALNGNIATRIYDFASAIFGKFRGGLGIATVAACAGFSAVTGSSVATAATIGRIAITEMRQRGYPAPLAAGVVASAGTLGILIPPSIIMVFYAILAKISIAKLLVAGIVPGILSALVIAVYIGIRGQREAGLSSESSNLDEALRSSGSRAALSGKNIRAIVWVLAIFASILIGVYSGLYTVIESAAVGSLIAFLVLVVENWGQGFRTIVKKLGESLAEVASLTGMTFGILVGASIFTSFLVIARVPQSLASWVTGLEVPGIVIIILILAMLIPLGMILDSISIIIITVPLFAPVISALGYDGIWFAILFVKMMEIGLLTPPVGLNTFVVAGASGIDVGKVFRGVTPFILLDILIVAVLMVFPDIVTFLPDLLQE